MNKKKIFSITTLLVASIICLGLYIHHFESRPKVFEAYFFHLNKGRSILLVTPKGKTILIDGGQNGEVIRELTKIFPFYRRRIDIVIVTSALPKNIGGLSEVLERYDVGKVYESAMMATSSAREVFEKVRKKKKIPKDTLIEGDDLTVDGVTLEALFPKSDFKYNKSSIPELVLKVEYATTTLVFLGDVSKTIQKSLISELEKVYLIEFAHGATKSRVSADLVSIIKPEVIVSSKREETFRFELK